MKLKDDPSTLEYQLHEHIVAKYRNQEMAAVAWGVTKARISQMLRGDGIPNWALREIGWQKTRVTTFKYERLESA